MSSIEFADAVSITAPGGAIRPVFREPALADATYRRQISQTKRLLEMIRLDPANRAELDRDPDGFLGAHGLSLDLAEARPLWELGIADPARLEDDSHLSLAIRRYRAWTREKLEFRDEISAGAAPGNPAMAAWRSRQMNRCLSQLGPAKDASIIHSPVAFELSSGCSVGCWFCGVGAERLSASADYSKDGPLWRATLQAVRAVVGEAARWGFCYWATEPLDNPDYESFCADFAAVNGRFPQTTTAIPLRDVERTRRLLRQSSAAGCELNRFSILSAKVLRDVHAAFSPEELMYVELLPLNKESGNPKVLAGNARTHRNPTGHVMMAPERASTIACVSGFLINLVELKVRLITPCHASDRWPLGYWEIDGATFCDAGELQREMKRMIGEHMPARLSPTARVALRPDLRYADDESAAYLSATGTRLSLSNPEGLDRVAAEVARDAGRSAVDIGLALEERGMPLEQTFYLLELLFRWGLLDEEPRPRATSGVQIQIPGQTTRASRPGAWETTSW